HRPAIAQRYFPTAKHGKYGFYVTGVGSDKEFSVLASRLVPDLALWGSSNGQFFPRYRWEPSDEGTLALDLSGEVLDGYRRIDNITDEFHLLMRERYGCEVMKDDVFFFLYGLLNLPEYRERYAGELKQM